jgi:hypothetical protein
MVCNRSHNIILLTTESEAKLLDKPDTGQETGKLTGKARIFE